jgi:outer membrane protein TolC
MQVIRSFAALAFSASAVAAQVPNPSRADTSARIVAGVAGDSVRLSRREAVAEALAHNPQLEIARALIGEARARKVEAVSIPDPAVTASLDQQRRLFQSGANGQKNVGIDMLIPFPNKLRLQGKVAQADVASSEYSYALQRQLIAAQTAEAYDSLLVALKHRADLTESETLAKDFLSKTQARFNAGTAAKLDVIRATVTLAQSSNDLLANALDVQTTGSALARLIGRLGEAVIPTDSLAIPDAIPSVERVLEVGLASRPELASIRAQRQGARAATSPDRGSRISRERAECH